MQQRENPHKWWEKSEKRIKFFLEKLDRRVQTKFIIPK